MLHQPRVPMIAAEMPAALADQVLPAQRHVTVRKFAARLCAARAPGALRRLHVHLALGLRWLRGRALALIPGRPAHSKSLGFCFSCSSRCSSLSPSLIRSASFFTLSFLMHSRHGPRRPLSTRCCVMAL